MDGSDVALVIPAFNEVSTVGRVVRDVARHGQPIVVDDCSGDETAAAAAAAGAVVVRHPANQGYDAALNSGFAEAQRLGFSYVVTLDADGQHDPELIAEFIDLLRHGNDLVMGVRPRPARFAEWLFGWYTRLRFGVRDPLCGMKGYNMSLYSERGWFDSYQSIGTELALYGLRRKKRTAQLRVPIRERSGAPRFASSIRANYRILRALALSGTIFHRTNVMPVYPRAA